MKLCQKCVDAIVGFMDSSGLFPVRPQREMLSRPFPESECEFWAHKELNRQWALFKRAEKIGWSKK